MKFRVYNDKGVCHDFNSAQGDILMVHLTDEDKDLITRMDPECSIYGVASSGTDTDYFRVLTKAYKRDLGKVGR